MQMKVHLFTYTDFMMDYACFFISYSRFLSFFENIAKNGKIYEEIFYIFCFIVLKCTRFAPFA